MEKFVIGTMPLASVIRQAIGRGPERRFNIDEERHRVTALEESVGTTYAESEVIVAAKDENPTDVTGGALALRKPLAEAAVEEGVSDN